MNLPYDVLRLTAPFNKTFLESKNKGLEFSNSIQIIKSFAVPLQTLYTCANISHFFVFMFFYIEDITSLKFITYLDVIFH